MNCLKSLARDALVPLRQAPLTSRRGARRDASVRRHLTLETRAACDGSCMPFPCSPSPSATGILRQSGVHSGARTGVAVAKETSTAWRRSARKVQPPLAALPPESVFAISTFAVMPIYAALLSPMKKLAQLLVKPPVIFIVFGLLYASVLPQVLEVPRLLEGLFAKQSLAPQVTRIAELFHHEAIVALAWVHLLMLDLFQARYVFLDSLKTNVFAKHSIVLCFMFGPTGLLCHLFTTSVTKWMKRSHESPDVVGAQPQP